MGDSPSSGRAWSIAVVFSLLCTGLGHIYSGMLVRGVVLFFLSLLVVPGIALLSLFEPSATVLWLVLGLVVLGLVLCIGAAIDAWRVARRAGAGYRMRSYNRAGVYVVFALAGVLYPVFATVVLRGVFLEAFVAPTASMMPTLMPRDRFFVRKCGIQGRAAERGRVIVFRCPEDRARKYVKRVVAVAGDRIAVRAGVPVVNGAALVHEPVGEFVREVGAGRSYRVRVGDGGGRDLEEEVVPSACVFVLGDNRAGSRDSRHFGCVPVDDVLGTADYLIWAGTGEGRVGVVR